MQTLVQCDGPISTRTQTLPPVADTETRVNDRKFLTQEEVSERYRGEITVGTLRNWRAMRIGPNFVKIGKAVLYPANELDAWDHNNTVTCRASKRRGLEVREDS